jgi:hypothetical protein
MLPDRLRGLTTWPSSCMLPLPLPLKPLPLASKPIAGGQLLG